MLVQVGVVCVAWLSGVTADDHAEYDPNAGQTNATDFNAPQQTAGELEVGLFTQAMVPEPENTPHPMTATCPVCGVYFCTVHHNHNNGPIPTTQPNPPPPPVQTPAPETTHPPQSNPDLADMLSPDLQESDLSDRGGRVPESIAQWLWDVQVDGYSIYEWTQYFAQFSDRQWTRYARNTYGGLWSEQEWAD